MLYRRVPLGSAWRLPRRARHPVLRIFLGLFALIGMIVLFVIAVVALLIDILLLPIRLLFRR